MTIKNQTSFFLLTKFKVYLVALIMGMFGVACGDDESVNAPPPKQPPALEEPPSDSYFYKVCKEIKKQPEEMVYSLNVLLLRSATKDCKEVYWSLKKAPSLKINSPEFSNLELLSEFNQMVWIDLSLTGIKSLDALAKFSKLNFLRARGCPALINFSAINNFLSLTVLNLYGTRVDNLDFIKVKLNSLHFLNLGNTKIQSLKGVAQFPNLTTLIAANNSSEFTEIGQLSKLRYLDISNTNFKSEDTIKGLPNLKMLIATGSELDKSFKKAGLHVKF